jgi:cytochrome bd-type quinol oxidase subunit 1
MATFGEVFGLGFALEGFSFFLEAIFIAIYVYGWDRMSPRLHFHPMAQEAAAEGALVLRRGRSCWSAVRRSPDRRMGDHRGGATAMDVYGVMRTSEAVTGAGGIPIGYGTMMVVYLGLAAAVAWMLRRFSRVPLDADAMGGEGAV